MSLFGEDVSWNVVSMLLFLTYEEKFCYLFLENLLLGKQVVELKKYKLETNIISLQMFRHWQL